MNKPTAHPSPRQRMLQAVKHLVTHKRPRRLRHRGRNTGLTQRLDPALDRQRREIRRRAAIHYRDINRLSAQIVGNTRIVNVDRVLNILLNL